jgi:hypothetical protein
MKKLNYALPSIQQSWGGVGDPDGDAESDDSDEEGSP